MPRLLTTAMSTAVTALRLAPVIFVEAQFLTGPLRIWTGYGDVTWDGKTWTGSRSGTDPSATPMMGSISTISESSTLDARGITLTMSGIPSDYISQILQECRQSYAVTVWVGALDLDTDAVLADPAIAFSGRMDVPQISEGGDACSVALTVESRFIDLQRPQERRYTHEDQQVDHPGDLGFEYVAQLQQLEISWGKSSNKIPSSRSGGPAGPIPRPVPVGL